MRGIPATAVLFVVLTAFQLAAGPLAAAPPSVQEMVDGDPVPIGTVRSLHSDVLDEDRSLFVCLPDGYEGSSRSYPVLFVLYGDQVRGYFAEAVHTVNRLSGEGSIPQMIVVGVVNVDRYRDLSPVGRRGNPSGIGPFSRFVAEELLPFVEGEFRTKDYRILVGPQAGAEFGLHTLATRPALFNAFIVEDPFSVPETRDLLMPMLAGLIEEGPPSPTFLQVTWADRAGFAVRTGGAEGLRGFEKLVSDSGTPNLTLIVNYVESSEDFLPPLLLKDGLRALFRGHRFPEDREVKGLADITTHYDELSARLGFDVDVALMTLVGNASRLAQNGEADAAEEILDYLILTYPESLDGYWQLANLCREQGDNERAIELYHKCLELMPNMRPAREWLDRLE